MILVMGSPCSFTMRVDGTTAGSVSVSGSTWSTPLIDFSLWDSGDHTVEVEWLRYVEQVRQSASTKSSIIRFCSESMSQIVRPSTASVTQAYVMRMAEGVGGISSQQVAYSV